MTGLCACGLCSTGAGGSTAQATIVTAFFSRDFYKDLGYLWGLNTKIYHDRRTCAVVHPFKTGFNFLWLHSEQYNENKKKNLATSIIILKIDVFIAVFHHSISHMCTGGVLVGPVHCFDTAAMSGLALIMGVIITLIMGVIIADFKLIHYYNNKTIMWGYNHNYIL